MSETRSLSVSEEGLPEDLETLLVLAKLLGVVPNILQHVETFGMPVDGEMRWMAVKSIQSAIEQEIKRREYETKWRLS